EDRQYVLDRSATRPHVRAFSGYEIYSERDPEVGPEFNYGGVVGINATWNIFDGFATKGRMQATRARREAGVQALVAARRTGGPAHVAVPRKRAISDPTSKARRAKIATQRLLPM